MRVATFNIRHGLSSAGRLELRQLARVCADLDVDLLALQEVDKWMRRSRWARMARRVARASHMEHAFAPALRKGWFGRYGNALLVKGGISDVQVLSLPATGEPRAALLATADTGSLSVSVAATHLAVQREERDRQLVHVIDALAKRAPPRLLLGDLNGPPADVGSFLQQAGLRLVETDPTFPATTPAKQIDHVAVDGLEVVSSEVPQTPMSDHRPIVVELRLGPVS
ncbi:MAG: endonuclease/exonuclease/phosphatase family protein [Actinomycetota bacterium]|nr:endonuclease/exonuclease/phosphatase family protein [Actinomycetota bacterium]